MLGFIAFLRENWFGNNEQVTRGPSVRQTEKLLEKSKYRELRFIYLIDSKQALVWDASTATHEQVGARFGLDWHSDTLNIRIGFVNTTNIKDLRAKGWSGFYGDR